MFENVISKDYVNANIRPCTCNDTIFNAALNETMLLDIATKFDDDFMTDLKADEPSTEMVENLDNGLRNAIGYYILSRVYRTGSITATKYGITEKMSDDSNPATNQQIVSNSNYFREMADAMIAPIVKKYKSKNNSKSNYGTIRIIGC